MRRTLRLWRLQHVPQPPHRAPAALLRGPVLVFAVRRLFPPPASPSRVCCCAACRDAAPAAVGAAATAVRAPGSCANHSAPCRQFLERHIRLLTPCTSLSCMRQSPSRGRYGTLQVMLRQPCCATHICVPTVAHEIREVQMHDCSQGYSHPRSNCIEDSSFVQMCHSPCQYLTTSWHRCRHLCCGCHRCRRCRPCH